MWKETLIASTLAIALAAVPAVAADQSTDAPSESPAASEAPASGQDGAATTEAPAAADEAAQAADLKGLPVYSSDGTELGDVVEVRKNYAGGIEALHFEMGGFLGLGSKIVEVESGDFTQADDRINLSLTAEEAKELPVASATQ